MGACVELYGLEGLDGAPQTGQGDDPEGDDGVDRAPEVAILCAACHQALTMNRHRISRAGAHRHTQMNPGGYFYTILCFSRVTGAVPVGRPSVEWSWFDGFAWTIMECRRCRSHLGWRFTAVEVSADAFFGLIASRIREGG